jgi:hypothetical protein
LSNNFFNSFEPDPARLAPLSLGSLQNQAKERPWTRPQLDHLVVIIVVRLRSNRSNRAG